MCLSLAINIEYMRIIIAGHVAGFSGRKAPKKPLCVAKSLSSERKISYLRSKVTSNRDFFGINSFISFIRLADFMLNSDILPLVSKRFFHTDFVLRYLHF